MQECDQRNSHISSKLHMIYISSNNDRHPVTKTFNPLHYTSPNYTSLHFTTLVTTTIHCYKELRTYLTCRVEQSQLTLMDPLCLGLFFINHAAALHILASTCHWLITVLRAVAINTAARPPLTVP
jgi:hypothetical protein